MAESLTDELLLASPFALMLPEARRQIAKRAAALDLPTRRFSPLSMQRPPGAPPDEDDEDE